MIATSTAIALAATAAAGSSVASAKMGASAQKKAASTAADIQQQQYNQTREDLAPFRHLGYGASERMSSMLKPGGFVDERFDASKMADDPGYAFRMSEGLKALERSGSAKGQTLSGGAMKSLADYSQGLASQEYGKAFDRWSQNRATQWNMLTGAANLGASGVAQTVQAGTIAANAQSEAAAGAGNAAAAGWMAAGNAFGGAANSVGQYYAMKDIFRKP